MRPQVSIVMAVYNGVGQLPATLDSVLQQEGVDFEFIIVDDGSSDSTFNFLQDFGAEDQRLVLIRQSRNLGLTQSLIRGCQSAQGKYIARADAGDLFLPGRLQSQFELLEKRPDIGLVSCGTRFVTDDGQVLYTVSQQRNDLRRGLATLELSRVKGPSHHGSTMFRREVYEQIGGYRACFRVAQDLDLWLRMSEVTNVLSTPGVFYEARLSPGDISITRREEQLGIASVILEGARCRRAGLSEPDYEDLLKAIPPSQKSVSRANEARYAYFVAGCLSQADSVDARKYFKRAWALDPLNLRYGVRYLSSLVR